MNGQPDVHVNVQPEAYVQVKIRGTALANLQILEARFGHILSTQEIIRAALNLYEMETNNPPPLADIADVLKAWQT